MIHNCFAGDYFNNIPLHLGLHRLPALVEVAHLQRAFLGSPKQNTMELAKMFYVSISSGFRQGDCLTTLECSK
jgi:hypothetical protein